MGRGLLMNGYHETHMGWDENGNVIGVPVFIPFWPLDPPQVAVVLLVCKGILTLDEAVNVTNLPAEHLISEAQSWAVASKGL
jgi:hypothetical protein